MKTLILSLTLVLITEGTAYAKAMTLSDYKGVYECASLMRTAPSIESFHRIPVTVKIDGKKVKLEWSEPERENNTFSSGVMGNGIVDGDFEYRGNGGTTLVSLSKTAAGPYLVFSFNQPEDGVVATACPKKN